MVIIRMTGGLGNQMFQYALYQKLISQEKEVKFDDKTEYELSNARPIMLWAFGIDYPKATDREVNKITDGFLDPLARVKRKLFGRKSLKYAEKDCNFDPVVLEKDPAYLTGYFQSEAYFADVEDAVREAFTFDEAIFDGLNTELKNKIMIYQIDIENTLSVSLHIRRGDYLSNADIYGGNCTEAYYAKAIEIIKERFPEAVFYVFSNEDAWAEDWCREQEAKTGSKFVPVAGAPEELGYLDMFLMSKCKHHIVANSSFSWWGAYLNPSKEKCVIAPARWYNNQDCKDIYTSEMLKVTAEGILIEA